MKPRRLNPFLLGAFIVGAVVLIVIALLFLGSANLFHPTTHFIFYLQKSAEGVDAGTAVNLEGLRVGEVNKVRILYDHDRRHSYVAVNCRIDRNRLYDATGKKINLRDTAVLQQLISDGLVAEIDTAGVVGAKLVELEFYPSSSAVPKIPAGLPATSYPVIPAAPSKMSQIVDDASDIVAQVRQADIPGAVRKLEEVLDSTHRQIGQLQTNQLASHISSAADSISAFMKSPDLRDSLLHIRSAAADLQAMITNVNARVPTVASNLNTTLVGADATARNLRDFLALRNQLGEQTWELLDQLDQAARSIKELADFLERHPNALIAGRQSVTNSP